MDYAIWRLGLFIKEAIEQINDLVLAVFWSCVVFFIAILVYGILSGWKYEIQKRIWLREHGNEEQDYHTNARTSHQIAEQQPKQAYGEKQEITNEQQKPSSARTIPLTKRDKAVLTIILGPILLMMLIFFARLLFRS
jgi:hypothetical protein